MIPRKYGVQTTISFPLIERGEVDFEDTPVVHAAGDSQINKDEGDFVNTTNAFAHEGNGIYSLVLTAAEMTAARIDITIIDISSAKSFEDQCIKLETYGNASAQHEFDLDSTFQAALLAIIGVTEGGTMTFQKLLKILAAWAAGNWRDKGGGVRELLDAEDGSTVILEMVLSKTTPYRTITVII